MADINEWLKAITFTIFGAILYYYFWTNIFSNILAYVVGQDSILGAFAWVSFIILFIFTVPLYFIYTIIIGSSGKVKTKPWEILKAIALWCISMPFLVVIYLVVDAMLSALPTLTINGASNAEVVSGTSTFSWFLALIVLVGLTAAPMYFILRGYGQIGGDEGERK